MHKYKNVLVIGGGGFIGSAIVDRLLKEDYFVRVLELPGVNQYRKFSNNEKIEWVIGDFLNKNDIEIALDEIDIVFHLISTTLPKGSNDDPIYDVQSNVIATLQMLNIMVQKNIQKIIFISSGGTVYGVSKYLPIDEKHPTNPVVSYGITKLTIEKYLMLYERMHGIKSIILRVSNPFGKRQCIENSQGVIGVFIHNVLHNKPIEIWGDGTTTRDYIYIDDVTEAFIKAITYNGSKRIFNISSSQGFSINELLTIIGEIFGSSLQYKYLTKRPFDVPINILCNKLAKKELSWFPKTSIQQGIAQMIKC